MTEQERLDKFTEELSSISIKYGITIQSIGGVCIFDKQKIKDVVYTNDIISGNLIPYCLERM